VFADDHGVAIAQVVFGDFFVVDEGAVGAAEVLDEGVFANGEDVGMLAADRQIVEEDVAPRPTTDFHVTLFDFDVINDFVVEFDDQFGHTLQNSTGAPVILRSDFTLV
jgi:hypothetical protein